MKTPRNGRQVFDLSEGSHNRARALCADIVKTYAIFWRIKFVV